MKLVMLATVPLVVKGQVVGGFTVDAVDVISPGRRYEEYDPAITYVGKNWTPHNDARVWSEGATATSNEPGATATAGYGVVTVRPPAVRSFVSR